MHLSTVLLLTTTLTPILAFPATSSHPPNPPAPTPLPLVIWHGLGDTFDADGLKSTAELAERVNPNTYVYTIRLSNSSSSDRRSTFFGNITTQLDSVCTQLREHPVLSKAPAINALGFSQGGQFLRGYIERCNDPPVKNLVTFGSQHNGIAKFQRCSSSDFLCHSVAQLLKANTWGVAQNTLVPAQYYRDPEDLESYLEHSNWLADVNNERGVKNETYAKNLAGLSKFAMYLFKDDQTVVPRESGWFAEVNGTTGEVTELRNRTIYKEDWLGLKTLDEKKGLVFREVEGKHMELHEDVLTDVFREFFAPDHGIKESLVAVADAVAGTAQSVLQLAQAAWIDL
jgi:palmitoyl-protein thioesterase